MRGEGGTEKDAPPGAMAHAAPTAAAPPASPSPYTVAGFPT